MVSAERLVVQKVNRIFLKEFLSIAHLFFVLLFCNDIMAQSPIDEVDFKRIKQKKVRKFLRHQQENEIQFFDDMESSVRGTKGLKGYRNFEKLYVFKESSEFVWNNYQYSSQTDVWDLNKISFAFLFDRNSSSIIYANQEWLGLEKGQIFYLNLKILNGFYNLPVAFEIINVDPLKKEIAFSYLKGGKTSGIQTIQMTDTEDGNTHIIHKSYVKSKSKIRDKYLYPYFHNKLINEFHNNMKKMINRFSRSSAEFAEVK